MPDFRIYAGDTSQTIYVRLRDSTTGIGKTGLVFNSTGVTCSYTLPGAARAAITLITLASASAAWASGGFILVDDTNAKGLYRLDLPDAAIASGKFTIISIEFDGIIEESMVIPLATPDVNVTELGGSAQSLADIKDFADDGYNPATNKIQGVVLVDTLTTYTSNTVQTGDSFALIGAAVGASISADIAAIKAETVLIVGDTNELQTDWTNGGRLDSIIDAILVDTAQLGAAVGASLSADIAAIKAETVLIVADTNELQTDWTNGGRLDLIIDAILVDTAVIGAAGAGLTSVGIIDISAAGLAKFLTVDTGETVAVAGSVGKIAQGSASGLTAAAIWANTTRTLTATAAAIAASVAGSDISVHRGDTLSLALTGLGDISDRTTLWFTIKAKSGDPADSAALVQITTAGLDIINGAAAGTSGNGSITVDDETAGDITVTLKAVETAKLEPSSNRVYDVQVLRSTGEVATLTNADCSIVEDVSRDIV